MAKIVAIAGLCTGACIAAWQDPVVGCISLISVAICCIFISMDD